MTDRDLTARTIAALALCVTRSGHLAQRVGNEHRGNCIPRCTPECRLLRGVLLDHIDRLEALDGEAPRQLALLGEATG